MTTYEDPRDTALRMISMYKHSKYTPEERATDHAFSYDSKSSQRKFWIAVLNHMNARKESR
jgi:hypothetical protein